MLQQHFKIFRTEKSIRHVTEVHHYTGTTIYTAKSIESTRRLEQLVLGSLVQSLLSQPEHKASTPISFSPILCPLKCFLALVLPLLVASWCTDLLNFTYLAHPAFHWRSMPHSISDEKKKKKALAMEKIWHNISLFCSHFGVI